jgi:hypothetical protein
MVPYDMYATPQTPQLNYLIVDNSHSMRQPIAVDPTGKPITKTEALVHAVQTIFTEAIFLSTTQQTIRDCFHFAGIKFGGVVTPLFKGRTLATPELAALTLEFRPQKGSPLRNALTVGYAELQSLLPRYDGCHPPIVFLLSDGEVLEGTECQRLCDDICGLHTQHGNVILVTCHLSVGSSTDLLHSAEDPSWTPHESLLFRCASTIPPGSHIADWFTEQGAGGLAAPPQVGDRLFFRAGDDVGLCAALAVVLSSPGARGRRRGA